MSPSVRFGAFEEMAIRCKEGGGGLSAFLQLDAVLDLRWPDDVVEQWLFDHPGNGHFLTDYGTIDLTQIQWAVEAVAASEFANLPTGASEDDAIEAWARQHVRNVELRTTGVHAGVGLCWEVHGTWKRWPLLIDRQLLTPAAEGLQVIEGRTRVGTLRGRLRDGLFVADRHLAWVARAAV